MFLPLLLLAGWFLGGSALALVVEPSAVQAQLGEAELVAEIYVESLAGAPADEGSITFRAQARIDRILEKRADELPVEGDRITLEGLGGESGNLGVYLAGYPRPHAGRRYEAHLKREGQRFSITGFEFGLKPIDGVRAFSRNRTDGSNGEGEGSFLFWAKNYLPVPYAISESTFVGHPDYVEAIDKSFRAWADPLGTRLGFLAVGCSRGTRNLNDGINHVILVTTKWPFDPAAIAITRNFYLAGDSPQSGMILDSDILLNGVNHEFSTTPVIGRHDIQNILTHEVGHFIGLGHEVTPFDNDATMFAQASPNEVKKRILKTSDLDGLFAAYEGPTQKPPTLSGPSCRIRDGAASSCIAVHQPATRPPSTEWLILIPAIALAVRFLARRILRGRS